MPTIFSACNQSLVQTTLAAKSFSAPTPLPDAGDSIPAAIAMHALPAAVPGQLYFRAVSFPPHKAVQSGQQTTPRVWFPPKLRENLSERAPSSQPESDHRHEILLEIRMPHIRLSVI